MERKGKKYQVILTEKQVRILSYACDQFSRLICGQDWSFQELLESAWERRSVEATGHFMDKEFEGGWHKMREEAEDICRQIKQRFWGLDYCTLNGVRYDPTADILFDIHQVLRHQLWLDKPEQDRERWTVDAYEGMQFGDEPMCKIKPIKDDDTD